MAACARYAHEFLPPVGSRMLETSLDAGAKATFAHAQKSILTSRRVIGGMCTSRGRPGGSSHPRRHQTFVSSCALSDGRPSSGLQPAGPLRHRSLHTVYGDTSMQASGITWRPPRTRPLEAGRSTLDAQRSTLDTGRTACGHWTASRPLSARQRPHIVSHGPCIHSRRWR
jgi:hypothetical protein